MKAIILAAGYATRLYPLNKKTPKPLLKIGGRPIIECIIDKTGEVKDLDITYIITNHTFKSHFDDWLNSYNTENEIKIIDDMTESNDNRLGSIGDMEFVIKKENINEDLLVIAGDTLFGFGLEDVVRYMDQKNGSVIVSKKSDTIVPERYGCPVEDENNRVREFEEKPKEPKSNLIAIPIYLFKKESLVEIGNCLKENPRLDAPGNFIKYLIKKQPVFNFTTKGEYIDIGTIKDLNEADIKYGGKGEEVTLK